MIWDPCIFEHMYLIIFYMKDTMHNYSNNCNIKTPLPQPNLLSQKKKQNPLQKFHPKKYIPSHLHPLRLHDSGASSSVSSSSSSELSVASSASTGGSVSTSSASSVEAVPSEAPIKPADGTRVLRKCIFVKVV